MKEVRRLVKKANSILNQVEEFVRSIEYENFGPGLITSIKNNLILEKRGYNMLSSVRESNRAVEQAEKLFNEKLKGIELTEDQKTEFEEMKG